MEAENNQVMENTCEGEQNGRLRQEKIQTQEPGKGKLNGKT